MLLMLVVSVSLFTLGVYATARAGRAALRHLGLDGMTVLLWFGLAERPVGPPVPRARG